MTYTNSARHDFSLTTIGRLIAAAEWALIAGTVAVLIFYASTVLLITKLRHWSPDEVMYFVKMWVVLMLVSGALAYLTEQESIFVWRFKKNRDA